MAVFPMDRNYTSPSTKVMLQERMIFLLLQRTLFSQNLMETMTGFLCRAPTWLGAECRLHLPIPQHCIITQVSYFTVNTQMPSNSHSGTRIIGNTVNYFSLTFSSQDKLQVPKGKHYELMMIINKWKWEQISQILSVSQALYRYSFVVLNT